MISISYLAIAFGSIAFFILGWFLNQFLVTNKTKDIKDKFLELEKEEKHLAKRLKKEKKQAEQLKNKAESWKHEFHALTQELQQAKKDHKLKLSESEDLLSEIRSEAIELKTAKDRITTSLEKLQKENTNLKLKYKKDVASGADWRSDRQKMERDLKDALTKLERSNTSAAEYKSKYDKQAEEINKIRVMEREKRITNTKLSKAEQDCAYWEKKHYDAHHELAQLKAKIEEMDANYKELVNLRKGDEILKSNLLEQIAEFKTKFVNVNNKYRDLVSNNN